LLLFVHPAPPTVVSEAKDMAEKKRKDAEHDGAGGSGAGESGGKSGGAAATAKPKRARKAAPKRNPPGQLPPWKVLLHNADAPTFEFVINTIVELTPLNKQEAELRTKEAHETGVALLLVTHKERAELYKDQFESKKLTVTIEPAEK
jgi:ATP-dependent Clp protease adapter protein ClpS